MTTKYHVFSPITGKSETFDTEEEARMRRTQMIDAYVASLAPEFSVVEEAIDEQGNSVTRVLEPNSTRTV